MIIPSSLLLTKRNISVKSCRENQNTPFFCVYRASCTVYYPDQQMHNIYIYIYINNILYIVSTPTCRSQWPRGLRRGSATARLLRSWLRIPPGAWMFVCCECCVLSGRGLCDELVTRPEESYRLCCVVVCDLETS